MTRNLLPLALSLTAGLAGCNSSYSVDVGASMEAGDLGVTPGGAQDIDYARDIIEQGGIPGDSSWSPEGLFSQHDLPLSGAECNEILCPRAKAAVVEETATVIAQVGFGTVITTESFERRDLDLALAVDISGSMSDGKLDAMKVALHALADRMTEDDTVSLVAFDNKAELRLSRTTMDDFGVDIFRRAIDGLEPDGATDIEAGMSLAYDQLLPFAATGGPEERVMLFTDAQPNVGATGIGSFTEMARTYGDLGIGLTVFGTGLDLGIELAEEMSEVRGGAYVYLPDKAAIQAAFDVDFDYMVTPLAYDLQVQLQAAEGWRFVDAVGAPMDDGAGDNGVEGIDFGASTLFLSANQGGMAILLAREPDHEGDVVPDAGAPLASFALSYVKADSSELIEMSLDLAYEGGTAWSNDRLGDSSPLADDLGVYKMSFLLDEIDALTMAGMFCSGAVNLAEARDLAHEARDRLGAVASQLEDQALMDEAVLMNQLWVNLSGGQGNCR